MHIANKQLEKSEEAKTSKKDACYDRIDETRLVNVKGGFMTFPSLQDDYDIKSRITAATKAFGALTKFWYNQHVDTYRKFSSSKPFQ